MQWLKEYENCLNKLIPNELDIPKSIQLKLDNFPKLLYRFRYLSDNPEKSQMQLDNLRYNTIYLSSPKDFNDPFDSKPSFDYKYLQELCKNYNKLFKCSEDELYSLCKNLSKHIEHQMINEFQIGCFSQNDFTNMLMWSHYANQHEGFCIEYDTNFWNKQFKMFCYPVLYTENMYENSNYLFSILLSCFDMSFRFNNTLPNFLVLFKKSCWKYEKEWRYVTQKESPSAKNLSINNPYKPKNIYVGYKTRPEHQDEIIDIAKKMHIHAYKMDLDKKKFELFPVKLY